MKREKHYFVLMPLSNVFWLSEKQQAARRLAHTRFWSKYAARLQTLKFAVCRRLANTNLFDDFERTACLCAKTNRTAHRLKKQQIKKVRVAKRATFCC